MEGFSPIFQCYRPPASTSPSDTLGSPHNLQRYVQEAVLPVMPHLDSQAPSPMSILRSDLHVLSLGSECRMGPDYVHILETFCSDARRFTDYNVPNQPVGDSDHNPHNHRLFTISPSNYHDSPPNVGDTSTLHGLVMWVMLYPMQSIRCLLHLCHPQTVHLDLHAEGDADMGISNLIQWVRFGPSERRERELVEDADEQSYLTVFVLTPWMFSNEDLEAFTEAFPESSGQFLESSGHAPNNIGRLWAKMRDICHQNGSRFFVLTTYRGWVFGAFSKGTTHAWISRVIDGYSKEPTILECLFYWFMSATGCISECSFEIPQVEPSSWEEDHLLRSDASCAASSRHYVDSYEDEDPGEDEDEDGMDIDGEDHESTQAGSIQCSSIGQDDDVHSETRERWGYSDDGIRLWDRDVQAVN
ncbi:hypothetical protein K466DRAFT_656394 [Polyporus arcularius HHB13444]|uniref:Uncharacterized protein n=1 Tax=Polyporus arcularius HHB13444 TaxID=1314778 RepID=A0A5C3NUI6_9APHY|nr:hypothetical protein K466DRAFT_656394 [Polyporus arcularius HHB13444]